MKRLEKLALIMPRRGLYKKGRGFRKFLAYAPLTLTTLASVVPEELGLDIRVIDEGVEEVDFETLDADVVGITGITGHIRRGYEIADIFRARGKKVIMGGVHSTLMPEEARQHADSVVIVYAYKTFPRALIDLREGRLRDVYREPNPSLENLPTPRRDLLKRRGYISTKTTQAVFGCPHKCEFCVISATNSGYLHRPIPEVIEDIRSLDSKLIFFLDPSPIEGKGYIKELYRQMIPLNLNWMGLSTSRIIDDQELLDLATESGCAGLLIGFESVSAKSLRQMNKGFNSLEKHYRLVEELHRRNIAIQGCFVFGSDADESSVFQETVDFVMQAGLDLPRYTVYTPFPTTPFFNRLEREGRLLTKDWNKYNCQNVVFQPKNMSVEDLEAGLEYAWMESYTMGNIARRLLKSRARPLIMAMANWGYRLYSQEHEEYK